MKGTMKKSLHPTEGRGRLSTGVKPSMCGLVKEKAAQKRDEEQARRKEVRS